MKILNFAHDLTIEQIQTIEELVQRPIKEIKHINIQFQLDQSFASQVQQMIDSLAIQTNEWQSVGWLIVLPSLNYITGVILAELHGRMGHFPSIVRLRPVEGSLVTEYEVAEIINLQQVREDARLTRKN